MIKLINCILIDIEIIDQLKGPACVHSETNGKFGWIIVSPSSAIMAPDTVHETVNTVFIQTTRVAL